MSTAPLPPAPVPSRRGTVTIALLGLSGCLLLAAAAYAVTRPDREAPVATFILSALAAVLLSMSLAGAGALAVRVAPHLDRTRSARAARQLSFVALGIAALAVVAFVRGQWPQRLAVILPSAGVALLIAEARRASRGYLAQITTAAASDVPSDPGEAPTRRW